MASSARSRSTAPHHASSPTDALPRAVASALSRYREPITSALHEAINRSHTLTPADDDTRALLESFYGQIAYHFGWRDARLAARKAQLGKLLRPTLVLLGYEIGASARTGAAVDLSEVSAVAGSAALAVEMIHNFSLIHDDIEDGDDLRHHRATLWRVWGQPQAINTGDGLFALARLTLFDLLKTGVPADLVVRLAALLDVTCLRLCEGQFLDMSFEGREDVTVPMYLEMIERKTAALMECSLEMGALLGGADEHLRAQLGAFGRALGMGFQLRDDLLGIWASDRTLGKVAAGDLRRKKMTLPVIYALEHAQPDEREALARVLAAEGPPTDEQIGLSLAILERTGARARALHELRAQCEAARAILLAISCPTLATASARDALSALIDFIAADTIVDGHPRVAGAQDRP